MIQSLHCLMTPVHGSGKIFTEEYVLGMQSEVGYGSLIGTYAREPNSTSYFFSGHGRTGRSRLMLSRTSSL